MSRFCSPIAVAFALLTLSGCAKDGTPENIKEAVDAVDAFDVVKLFTKDQCTVYRFYDNGRYHYFTNCSGTTMSTESCGKNCTRPTQITGK